MAKIDSLGSFGEGNCLCVMFRNITFDIYYGYLKFSNLGSLKEEDICAYY